MTAPTDAERAFALMKNVIKDTKDEAAIVVASEFVRRIAAALSAVRAQERERAARIAEETDSDAFPRGDFPRMIADAIRRQEG